MQINGVDTRWVSWSEFFESTINMAVVEAGCMLPPILRTQILCIHPSQSAFSKYFEYDGTFSSYHRNSWYSYLAWLNTQIPIVVNPLHPEYFSLGYLSKVHIKKLALSCGFSLSAKNHVISKVVSVLMDDVHVSSYGACQPSLNLVDQCRRLAEGLKLKWCQCYFNDANEFLSISSIIRSFDCDLVVKAVVDLRHRLHPGVKVMAKNMDKYGLSLPLRLRPQLDKVIE